MDKRLLCAISPVGAKGKEPTLLIVDDDPLVIKALQLLLTQNGYSVITAQDGLLALDYLQQEEIALIICDLTMPTISGVQVLQAAKKLKPDAVRIGLTGNFEHTMIVDAINLGQMAYFILKPWDNSTVLRLIATALERYRLIKENQHLQKVIDSQNQKLSKHNQALFEEIQLGAKIHEKLLIGKLPQASPYFESAFKTMPCQPINGDFFDFFNPIPTQGDLVIGDVMGKGMPAALLGVAVKAELRHFANPFIHGKYCAKTGLWSDDLLTPQDIIKQVDSVLNKPLRELDYFVSLFYGRFDFTRKSFTFVDCGAPKPLHYSKEKKSLEILKGNALPIGSVEEASYQEKTIFWGNGDLFIFYSDGITEAKSVDKETFGLNRLLKVIKANVEKETEGIAKEIQQAFVNFTHKQHFDDDMTLLVLKMKAPKLTENSPILQAKFLNDLEQTKNVRSFVLRLCHKMPGERAKFSTHLQLAINEAFCNIVKHSYKEEKGKQILFQGALLHDGLLIEISDQGEGFNPEEVAAADLSGSKESGYGLYIIKEVADEVSYLKKREKNGWNRLRIFKRYRYYEVPMELEHAVVENILVVTLKGESLDGHDAREFKEKVIAIINQHRSHNVIIDLKQLQFIDSSGLGSFLAILKNLHGYGGELKLVHMNKPIRTIFELVSMHKIFEIFESTEDAMLSLK